MTCLRHGTLRASLIVAAAILLLATHAAGDVGPAGPTEMHPSTASLHSRATVRRHAAQACANARDSRKRARSSGHGTRGGGCPKRRGRERKPSSHSSRKRVSVQRKETEPTPVGA